MRKQGFGKTAAGQSVKLDFSSTLRTFWTLVFMVKGAGLRLSAGSLPGDPAFSRFAKSIGFSINGLGVGAELPFVGQVAIKKCVPWRVEPVRLAGANVS
jgi:hypothetical protein